MMKGISPIISTVILIAIIFSIATFVSPWIFQLITSTTNQTSSDTSTEIKCMNAAYDFDTGYGTYGVKWEFSTQNDTLGARIKNTGTVNLHSFQFELTFNDTIISYHNATSGTQRTRANPLKPGQSAFLNASFTDNVNDTLTAIKILNGPCPSVYVSQEL
ncbi:MAG: hypothetical protein DRO99_00670 [Candidatus Aenigmatarchaeota archaeon]|nr:MAG: hypothetical protein DRO99_00670 [Candidatus Aenigmarchaeota archaeon]